jgi:hypothetical protein
MTPGFKLAANSNWVFAFVPVYGLLFPAPALVSSGLLFVETRPPLPSIRQMLLGRAKKTPRPLVNSGAGGVSVFSFQFFIYAQYTYK